MAHDSLCPDASLTGGGCEPMCELCDDCQCELIALVRQNEREAAWESFDDTQRWDDYMKGTMME